MTHYERRRRLIATAGGACPIAVLHEQKRDEARMLAEALLDAEVRIGELFAKMPKATAFNNPSGLKKGTQSDSAVELGSAKSKSEALQELGFSPKQAERLETLASHPDLVEQRG